MKMTSKTIIFFGNERLATGVTTTAPILRSLIARGYKVAAVVSNYHSSDRPLEIEEVARHYNIPLILPEKPVEIIEKLKNYNASLGVLVAYGKIVPQSIIDIFPQGIVNIHPSLLPQHRGPTPIESAILDGDKHTGVSLMQLAAKMDAGAVFARAEIELTGQETKQALADHLSEIAESMLLDRLPEIINGEAIAVPQEDSLATYDKLISKSDGEIDWSKPAEQIEREVRAFAEWPKSHTKLANTDVIITQSVVTSDNNLAPGQLKVEQKKLLIGCGQSSTLEITKLKPAGKKEMTAEEFLAGYSHNLAQSH